MTDQTTSLIDRAARRFEDEYALIFGMRCSTNAAYRLVRGVLEEAREPTARMCDAGEGFNLRCGCPDCDLESWEKVRVGWQAMIDEALK